MGIQRYNDIADRAFSDAENEKYNARTEDWLTQYADYIKDWFGDFVWLRPDLRGCKTEYELFDKFVTSILKEDNKYTGKKSFEMAYKFITELKEKMEHIGLLY